jgi:3-hydroxyisobutyrate dehydrogenase-like beta-hydroxyacid dehydrogenase
MQELSALGMTPAKSPAEVAASVADGVIVLSVTNTECTQQVLEGPEGLWSTLRPGCLIIDMGSNQVTATRDWQKRAQASGADWLDAPVSGGQVGARDAALTIMCGGSQAAFARALPLLSIIGKTVRHLGESGSGQVAKLANQIIVASNIAAVSEALMLAKAHRLDPSQLREVLLGGFAASRVLDLHGHRMVTGDFAPGGAAVNQLKDVREAIKLAGAAGLHLPILETNLQLWQAMIDAGLGDLDHSALYRYYGTVNHSPALVPTNS